MKELMNKKGQISLGDIPGVVQVLVVIAIFLAIGALVVSRIGATLSGTPENITNEGLNGLASMGDFQSTWAIVIAAAVLIGIVATAIFISRR